MQTDVIDSLINEVFQTLGSPHMPDTPHLDALFSSLQTPIDNSAETESMIWHVWCSHEQPDAQTAMNDIMKAFDDGKIIQADEALAELISRWPTWAEAWNKRATLRFVQERDVESLQDVVKTLAREPRHFGALGGFGQIYLRLGEPHWTLLGFKKAIEINPNMARTMGDVITDLE